MNHPVIIEPYYIPTTMHFEQIPVTNAKDHDLYLMVEKFKCPDDIGFQWPKLRLSIMQKHPKKIIRTFHRNYWQVPPIIYTEQNNQKYVITSRDYQCISVYNVSQDIFTDYVYGGEEAYANARGFCPSVYKWDGQNLTVIGSVFNGPPEIMIIKNVDLNDINFNEVEWQDYYED